MRDSLGKPCVIDALIGSAPPAAINRLDWLPAAIADAREFRVTGQSCLTISLMESMAMSCEADQYFGADGIECAQWACGVS